MKKLLSVLLSLALVACMMPSMVYAGSVTAAGVTASTNGKTVAVTGIPSSIHVAELNGVNVQGKVDGNTYKYNLTASAGAGAGTCTATPTPDSTGVSQEAWDALKAVAIIATVGDNAVSIPAYELSNVTGTYKVQLYLPAGNYKAKGLSVTLKNAMYVRSDLGVTVDATKSKIEQINNAIDAAKSAKSINVDVEIVPNPIAPVTPPSNTETTTTVETDKDGNTITTETTVNKDTGDVTEKVETVRPDGSKSEVTTETKTETKTDGTEVKTENKVTVETDKDGNKTETKVETEDVTRPDGTQTTTTTTTAADKSVEIVEIDKDFNNFDNKVVTETTTTISSGGVVTNVEQTITIGTKIVGPISVDVKMDNEGAVEEAVAEYTRTGANAAGGVKTLLNGNHLSQVVNAVGADAESITVKATINNASGKKAYTVSANAADLTKGNKLYVLAVDKNGKQVLVNAKSYAVSKNGSVNVTLPSGMDYQLVTKAEKDAAVKAIKATIAPTATKKSVTKGKTSTMSLKKTLNKANVSKITYSTTSKAVATVSKTGKITAKKKGTVTIKATVTLKDGSKKTVSTKITVK